MNLCTLKVLAGLLAIYPLLHAALVAAPATPRRLGHSVAESPSSYSRRRDDVYEKANPDSITREEYKTWTGVTDDIVPSKRPGYSDVDAYTLARRPRALDFIEVSGGTKFVKRAHPVMSKWLKWGDTWRGYILEEPGWTTDTIKEFARLAYADIKVRGGSQWTVVAALWVPGKGCFIGSIPKGEGIEMFERTAPHVAPLLWRQIRNRELIYSDYAKWHAEDMACYLHEQRVGTYQDGQYPDNSVIFSYGLAGRSAVEGPKPACRDGNTGIRPPCQDAMNNLNVGV